MNLELNITLQDTTENFNKLLADFPSLKMKLGDLEYDVAINQINKTVDAEYRYVGFLAERYAPRKITVSGFGLNSKQKEIDEAVALVNKTKKDYKEAQRKLSELNGPKAQ